MKISFFTMADFGKKKNTLTSIASTIISAIEPNNVYCRHKDNTIKAYKTFNSKKKITFKHIFPGGSFIIKIFTALHIWSKGWIIFTKIQTKIIIFFLRKIKDNSDIKVFHYTIFKEVLEKNQKGVTVSLAQSVNTDPILDIIDDEHRKFKISYDKAFYREFNEAIKKSNYIIANSKFVKEALGQEGYPKNNIFVCPTGINPEEYKPKRKEEQFNAQNKFIVISVADFTINKGVQYIIEAWEKLQLKNAELWLVGHKQKQIEERINNSLSSTIKNIPHGDVKKLYQKASVFVLGSLSEGSARVTYEAMASELPCIVTINSGPVVRNGIDGYVGPIKNSQFFEEKILEYYTNRRKCEEHGKNARKNILEHYTWEHYKKKFKDIIKTIAKREGLKDLKKFDQ